MQVFAAWVCVSCMLVPAFAKVDHHGDCAGDECEENASFDLLQVAQQVYEDLVLVDSETDASTKDPGVADEFRDVLDASEYAALDEEGGGDDGAGHVAIFGPGLGDAQLAHLSGAVSRAKGTLDCDRDYVMFYTLGKTGSTSMQVSLMNLCGWGAPLAFTTQDKYPQGIKPQHVHAVARDFLKKAPSNRRVWIVTMTRNPFDRLVSMFFQYQWPDYDKGVNKSIPEYIDLFHSYLVNGQCNFDHELEFYDNFHQTTGVDILRHKFDFKHKHIHVSGKHDSKQLTVLLLRLEDSAHWPHIMQAYWPGYTVTSANAASDKSYGQAYNDFKAKFVFTEEEASMCWASGELDFFSPKEKRAILCARSMPRSWAPAGFAPLRCA